MNLAALIKTTRPPFLILAPICVLYGIAITYNQHLAVQTNDILLLIVGALLAHISVNTFNEYFDFRSGLDLTTKKTPFSGGSGALPQSPQMASATLWLAIASLIGLSLIGVYYIYLLGTPILLVGVAGIALIFFYTQWINKLPWLCLIAPGMGFGLLIPAGSVIVLGGELNPSAIMLMLIPFALVNNLLLLNQFPDIDADKTVGRRTLPIVYGTNKSSLVLLLFSLMSVTLLLALVTSGRIPMFCIIGLCPMALSIWAFTGARKMGKSIGSKPAYMAANVVATLVTPSLIALGVLLGS